MNNILLKPYIPQLLSRYKNYRRVDAHSWKCSCPFCDDGDLSRNEGKARGGVFLFNNPKSKTTYYQYNCFRCGASMSFLTMLKRQDKNLYNKLILEAFGEPKPRQQPQKVTTPKPVFEKINVPEEWVKLIDLPDNHEAVIYFKERKMPHLDRFYYSDDFMFMVNKIIPDKYKKPYHGDKRIIIPMIDKEGKLLKFQGRSLEPNAKIRYITIELSSGNDNYFWEKYLDRMKAIYVAESPLDALFIDNCISVAGSSLTTVKDKYPDSILIYDNEPKAEIIIGKMGGAIDDGFKLLIWDGQVDGKDINEMILNDSELDMNEYIKTRVFSGMMAKIQLAKFRRC